MPASDVPAWAKEKTKPSYTKSEVGLGNVDNTADADKPVSAAQRQEIYYSFCQSNAYTDDKIAELIDGAPETMDTIKEVADAIAEHKEMKPSVRKQTRLNWIRILKMMIYIQQLQKKVIGMMQAQKNILIQTNWY